MNFYRRHWYDVGCVLFMALAFTAGLWTPRFSHIQVILIYSFMAVLVHQYEEYAAPGGFPGIFNIAVLGERQVPERYPLNENQVLITNVVLAYLFYIAPILWPHLIWLGLAQIFFGMLQLVVHGVLSNIKLKSFYNPGLGAVIFLHLPIGFYYIHYVLSQHLATTRDFVWGSVATVLGALAMIILPIRLMASKTSPYAFPEDGFLRYDKEKLKSMLQP